MKWLMVLLIGGIGNSLWAQTPKQDPPYKKNPVLPELEIMQPNNSLLTRNQLKKQATLIIYFSPDCDHCIQQMDEMSKRMNDLKKLQVVMVTYQPMEQLVDFVKKYKLADHSNFKTGRDIKFQLPGFYQIKSLPYFALYDKDFKLITTFESNTKVDKLLKAFRK
jgi:cytochrome oxidase Cu insertion factor (SCO1/SenC/PrrC family)